jgi:ATP-binding cassette subfamily B protein
MSARDGDTDRATTRRRIGLMARMVRLADRRLIVLIGVTLVLSSLAGAMQSVALKWIVDSSFDQNWTTAIAAAGIGGLGAGLLGAAFRAMGDTEHVVTNEVGLVIDRNTLELTASIPSVEHLERPAYLDRLMLVRDGGPSLMRAVFTLTRTLSLLISLIASLWLLARVDQLLLLLPLFAIPTAVLVPRSERYVDRSKTVASERQRAASQLHNLFITPTSAMELRVFDCDERLDQRADELWRDVSRIHLGGSIRSALLASIGWLALTAGYIAALLFTAQLAIDGRATVGDIVLVSQLALLIRGTVAQTADAARRASAALRTADRFLWLEDIHAEAATTYSGTAAPPNGLRNGITFDHVSFTYPGTSQPVLNDIDLHVPAGTTVAFVGSNGAGKTTLVKLLTGMYRPTSGRILIDGQHLDELDIDQWRHRLAGTLQNYLRIESLAATTVGLGDPKRHDDLDRVNDAVDRSGARPVIASLPDGLDTPLGNTYHHGEQLSGGQWQRLAIARGMMPTTPLCLVLDEPTAALDPAAEQALYDHYRNAATSIGVSGAITVLISHRFSSVRIADLIVVFDNGTITEVGTHDALLAADGDYARMYRRQASAYT